MNNAQWYVWAFVFVVGHVLCWVTIGRYGTMPLGDVTFAVWSGVHILLGKVCLLGAVGCFICGLLEKENIE